MENIGWSKKMGLLLLLFFHCGCVSSVHFAFFSKGVKLLSFIVNIKKCGMSVLAVFLFLCSASNIYARSISIEQFWEAVSSGSTNELRDFFDEIERNIVDKSEIKCFVRELVSSRYAGHSLSSAFEKKIVRSSKCNFIGLQCSWRTSTFWSNPIGYIFKISDIRNHLLGSSCLLKMEMDLLDMEELPGKMVIGAVEMFCGVLLLIIPNPLTRAAGTYLVTDGATRMFDGLEILDEKNKELQQESCAYTWVE